MIQLSHAITPTPPGARGSIYIPMILGLTHNANAQELEFLRAVLRGEQHREGAVFSTELMQGARLKAQQMAASNTFAHILNGVWPNQAASAAGCHHSYAAQGNQIESIAAGSPDPMAIYQALVESPMHRDHITGKGFFAKQTSLGAGFAEDPHAAYRYYWVFWSATCEGA